MDFDYIFYHQNQADLVQPMIDNMNWKRGASPIKKKLQ